MRIINLIVFGFALLAALQSLRLFVMDRTSIRTTVLWTTLWIGIAVFGLYPALLDHIMAAIQMESRTFFIAVVGLAILYRLQFRSTQERDLLERRVGRLTQEVALLRYQLEQSGREPEE